MALSADIEWRDGRRHSITPFQLYRKRKPLKQKHLWRLVFNLPLILKNIRQTRGIKKVTLKASLRSSELFKEVHSEELILLPPLDDNEPQLQITTSTKRPMFGGSIILHVRSNFVLDDFHCVVTNSKGKLLTTR